MSIKAFSYNKKDDSLKKGIKPEFTVFKAICEKYKREFISIRSKEYLNSKKYFIFNL